jgi:hypothetical protein
MNPSFVANQAIEFKKRIKSMLENNFDLRFYSLANEETSFLKTQYQSSSLKGRHGSINVGIRILFPIDLWEGFFCIKNPEQELRNLEISVSDSGKIRLTENFLDFKKIVLGTFSEKDSEYVHFRDAYNEVLSSIIHKPLDSQEDLIQELKKSVLGIKFHRLQKKYQHSGLYDFKGQNFHSLGDSFISEIGKYLKKYERFLGLR